MRDHQAFLGLAQDKDFLVQTLLAKFWFDFHGKGCCSKQHNRAVKNLTLIKTFKKKHSNKLLQWLMRNKLTGSTVHKTWTSSSTYFAKLSRKPLHSLQIHKKIRYSGIVGESIFVNISRETFNLERIWKWNAIWSRKKKVDTFSSADRLQLMH